MLENLGIVACIAVHGLHGTEYWGFNQLQDIGPAGSRGERLVKGLHSPTKHCIGLAHVLDCLSR